MVALLRLLNPKPESGTNAPIENAITGLEISVCYVPSQLLVIFDILWNSLRGASCNSVGGSPFSKMQALFSNVLVVAVIGIFACFSPCSAAPERIGKIIAYAPCKEDVVRLCGAREMPNDLAVLDCLQDRRGESDSDINPECHSVSFFTALD